MELKAYQMIWFQCGKYSFYVWNEFRIKYILTYRIRPLNMVNHKIAPWGAISPTLITTELDN